jgi:hypothetical protein
LKQNFEKWNKLQIGTNFEIGKKFENGTTFKMKQFQKWNKLQIGTNFEFDFFEFKQIPKSEHIKI